MTCHPGELQSTWYQWMQQGNFLYEDYGGLTDRHISIEDGSTALYCMCAMRVKAAKRPDRPKKRDKCEKPSG